MITKWRKRKKKKFERITIRRQRIQKKHCKIATHHTHTRIIDDDDNDDDNNDGTAGSSYLLCLNDCLFGFIS